MLIMHAMDFLYLCPPMKYEANWVLNSLKVPMELGINLLNQILAGKAQHIILFVTPCRCIKVLKDSR